MNKVIHLISLILTIGQFFGCAHFFQNRKILDLNSLQKIKPGISSQSEIEKVFGPPDSVWQEEQEVTWLYFSADNPSISKIDFSFAAHSKIVESMGWRVEPSDMESELEFFMSNTTKKFIIRKPDWFNPHYAPVEVFYDNDSLGLRIIYSTARNQVQALVWAEPGTKMSRFDPSPIDPKIDFSIGRSKGSNTLTNDSTATSVSSENN